MCIWLGWTRYLFVYSIGPGRRAFPEKKKAKQSKAKQSATQRNATQRNVDVPIMENRSSNSSESDEENLYQATLDWLASSTGQDLSSSSIHEVCVTSDWVLGWMYSSFIVHLSTLSGRCSRTARFLWRSWIRSLPAQFLLPLPLGALTVQHPRLHPRTPTRTIFSCWSAWMNS